MSAIRDYSAVELLHHFRNKTLSPVEVARDVLVRIAQYNEPLNAFCLLHEDETLEMARASEKRWLRGEPCGLADGLPATVKDMLWQKGFPNRRGSRVSSDEPVAGDSPAVARLRESGAVFVGRTTLPEFAWKTLTDSPLTGVTGNPWDTRKTPGGSSGGAAAAAALNLGVLHLGTDAGGSIRIPASFCGIFGFKPSFGRVPTYPASSFVVLSHVGPMTRTVGDAALMMSVIAQPDRRDLMSDRSPAPDYPSVLDRGVQGLRIAWSPDLGYVGCLDPEVRDICARAVGQFEKMGAIVEQTSPGFPDPLETIRTLWRAGAAATLKGIARSRHDQLDPDFVACARAGEKLTAVEFLDAFNARTALANHMHAFHDRYDILVTPTVPIAAFGVERNVPESWSTGEWLDWTPYSCPFNLTQQPAATVPCGMTSSGLPVGLQIVAPLGHDVLVLQVAQAFERAQPARFLHEPEIRSTSDE